MTNKMHASLLPVRRRRPVRILLLSLRRLLLPVLHLQPFEVLLNEELVSALIFLLRNCAHLSGNNRGINIQGLVVYRHRWPGCRCRRLLARPVSAAVRRWAIFHGVCWRWWRRRQQGRLLLRLSRVGSKTAGCRDARHAHRHVPMRVHKRRSIPCALLNVARVFGMPLVVLSTRMPLLPLLLLLPPRRKWWACL